MSIILAEALCRQLLRDYFRRTKGGESPGLVLRELMQVTYAQGAAVTRQKESIRLDWIAENGVGIRGVGNGTKNVLVWGEQYPNPKLDVRQNLRAAIDAALAHKGAQGDKA